MTIDMLHRPCPPLAERDRRRGCEAERDAAAGSGEPTPDASRPDAEQGRVARAAVPFEGGAHWPAAVFDHARLRAAGCLAAGVANGFNDVMQALLGGLDLAIDDVGREARKHLDVTRQVGQRGTRLIEYLLSFSCQRDLRAATLDLAPTLADLSRLLGRSFGRDVWIRVETSPALPFVLADAAHLDTALWNLVLNAREAMPDGGELWIETYAEDGRVVVAVSDNGTGMAPEVLARACEPFYTTKDVAGSGLGLSMVYGFAHQSGGGLRIRSAQGRGTRVELLLPVAPSPAAAAAAPARARVNGRVLVVEDGPEVRRVTATFLRKAGFEVIEAGNGGDVLDGVMVSGPGFDVLVTDYAMPGMDGVELVHHVRQLRPGLPVLVVSGHIGSRGYGSGSGSGTGLEQLPADVEVLRKPFQREEFVRKVKRLMEGVGESPAIEARRVTRAEGM